MSAECGFLIDILTRVAHSLRLLDLCVTSLLRDILKFGFVDVRSIGLDTVVLDN